MLFTETVLFVLLSKREIKIDQSINVLDQLFLSAEILISASMLLGRVCGLVTCLNYFGKYVVDLGSML